MLCLPRRFKLLGEQNISVRPRCALNKRTLASLLLKPEVVKLEVGGPQREEAGSCVLTEADWL